MAVQAEATTFGPLRAAYAERYRRLVGVLPAQRQEFRTALTNLQGLTLTELLQLFEIDQPNKSS